MIIDRVDLRDLQREADGVSGVVIFQTQTGQVSILVRVSEPDDPALALIAQALRQLQRMPGFRCGIRELRLNPDATIEAATGA